MWVNKMTGKTVGRTPLPGSQIGDFCPGAQKYPIREPGEGGYPRGQFPPNQELASRKEGGAAIFGGGGGRMAT